MTADFVGRTGTALVSGGTGGIGAAVVRMLAERGAAVVFTYRSSAPSSCWSSTPCRCCAKAGAA